MIKTRSRGFTLVEILVVIAILAVLAATTAVLAPKILRNSKQAKGISQMRQMIPLMQAHANDHGNRLPAPMTAAADNDSGRETYWHVVLQQELDGRDINEYLSDRWWKDHEQQTIFVNPLHPKPSIRVNSVGYAMNAALASNLASNRGENLGTEEAKTTGINLATVREPQLSPIIVPHWDYFYLLNSGEAKNKKFEPYIVKDRIPVLFLDGHVDTMTPEEYSKRELDRAPKPE